MPNPILICLHLHFVLSNLTRIILTTDSQMCCNATVSEICKVFWDGYIVCSIDLKPRYYGLIIITNLPMHESGIKRGKWSEQQLHIGYCINGLHTSLASILQIRLLLMTQDSIVVIWHVLATMRYEMTIQSRTDYED